MDRRSEAAGEMAPYRAAPARARSRRAYANDGALLSSAYGILADAGWDGMIFAAVAERAGLTVRPVNDRFSDRGELAANVWAAFCAQPLTEALDRLVSAVVSGTPDDAFDSLAALQNPSTELKVASELLVAARYAPPLFEAVQASLEPLLSAASAQVGDADDPPGSRAAAHLIALVAGTGLLLAARRTGSEQLNLRDHVTLLAEAVAEPDPHQALPLELVENFEHMTVSTDDVGLDALLNAMLREVAVRGYQGATTARIVASAGVSQGLFYGRYASKLDLFIDAIERRHRVALQYGENLFTDLKWRFGTAVAEAMMWREYLRPEFRLSQNLALETLRLSWHEPRLRARTESAEEMFIADRTDGMDPSHIKATRAQQHWDLALGHGTSLLSQLAPEAHALPLCGILSAFERALEARQLSAGPQRRTGEAG